MACATRRALDSPSRRLARRAHRGHGSRDGRHTFQGIAFERRIRSHRCRSHAAARPPLRDHVANSVRRYLRDLDGCDTEDLYEIALRELEIPLFAEVLNHCDGNQSRAAAMLGIHRATLRKKLQGLRPRLSRRARVRASPRASSSPDRRMHAACRATAPAIIRGLPAALPA